MIKKIWVTGTTDGLQHFQNKEKIKGIEVRQVQEYLATPHLADTTACKHSFLYPISLYILDLRISPTLLGRLLQIVGFFWAALHPQYV